MISATIKKDTEIHGSPLQRCFVFVFNALYNVAGSGSNLCSVSDADGGSMMMLGQLRPAPFFLYQHLYRATASTRVRKTVPVMFRED